MASISFYSKGVLIPTGSGLGFYGDAGFGSSVTVGGYQGTTYITNSTGSTQGASGNNIKYHNVGSGLLTVGGTATKIDAISYHDATLQIRFDHTSEVQAQNAELRVYDRSNINNNAVGVTTQAAEIVHPWIGGADTTGSGVNDGRFYSINGSGSILSLSPSPGPTGVFVGNGTSTYSSTIHDWYVGMSASPNSIGSKTSYGLYVSLEYL